MGRAELLVADEFGRPAQSTLQNARAWHLGASELDHLRASTQQATPFLKRTDSALWRRLARAFVQFLACLVHRDARPACGGANVGDRRVHGVLPEVVGLP
jgi:hypothetical protein